jgi:hypothetical protein
MTRIFYQFKIEWSSVCGISFYLRRRCCRWKIH